MVIQITPWDRAALQLLADGASTRSLADRFLTTEVDLEVRLSTLFARMGVSSRSEAIQAAIRRGLVTDTVGVRGRVGARSSAAVVPSMLEVCCC